MLRRRLTGLGTTALLALLLCLCFGPASSLQAGLPDCTLGDALDPDAPCCETVDLTLPSFPPFDLEPMRYLTWNRCSLARNKEVCASFGIPTQTTECGVYQIPFTMRTCGQQATALFSGDLTAIYMRTFRETIQIGKGSETVQVWRFLLNGDLEVSPFVISRFGTNPNVPQSYVDYGNQTYWAGYIDYRVRCDAGKGKGPAWEIEWVLNHECDRFAHPKGGNRPGVYNPERSFTMAPFDFTPLSDDLGAATFAFQPAGGLREVEYTSETTAVCKQPSRPSGQLLFLDGECLCADGKLPLQYARVAILADSDCGFSLGTGKTLELYSKIVGFFPAEGGEPNRFPVLLVGDAEWLQGCDKTNARGYNEGVMVLSNPGVFTFTTLLPGKGKGGFEPLDPYFIDLANSADAARNPVQGAPHVSNKMGHLNFFDF